MTHKDKTELFLRLLLAKHFWAWALPQSVLDTSVTLHWRKLIFLFHQLSIANRFLVRNETLRLLLLSVGTFVWTKTVQLFPHVFTVCNLAWISVMFYLKDAVGSKFELLYAFCNHNISKEKTLYCCTYFINRIKSQA